MNTCPNCSTQIDSDSKFCKECGASLSKSSSEPVGGVSIVDDTLIVHRCPICKETHRYSAQVTQSMNYRQMSGIGEGIAFGETRAMGGGLQDRMMRPGRMGPQSGGMPGARFLPCLTTGKQFKISWPPR